MPTPTKKPKPVLHGWIWSHVDLGAYYEGDVIVWAATESAAWALLKKEKPKVYEVLRSAKDRRLRDVHPDNRPRKITAPEVFVNWGSD